MNALRILAVTASLALASACAHAPAKVAPEPAALPAPLAKDPTALAVPKLDFDIRVPEIRTLDNGIRVYLMPDRSVPLVSIRAQFLTGGVDDPAEQVGLSNLTFEMMASGGAGQYAPDALDELLEFHAANLGTDAGGELSGASLNIRSSDLDALLPVFADVVLRPRFDPKRFEIQVSRWQEAIRRRPDNPSGLASRALAKAVYGPDAPFGREITAASLGRIRVEDLKAHHQKVLATAGIQLIASGDFDPEALMKRFEALFGQLPTRERIERVWPKAPALERRVIYVPRPNLAQAKIRIGAGGFTRHDEIELAARVMGDALGGGLGAGRMFREIRDRMGLAYSAYAAVHPGPTGGMFFTGADTRPDAVGRSIEAMLRILDEARNDGFGDDEISHATDRFLSTFVFRFDSPGQIARERAVYDALGYPESYLADYRDRVAAVDSRAAHLAAQRLLHPGAWQIVVVGPEGLEKELERFGPITIIRDVEAFR